VFNIGQSLTVLQRNLFEGMGELFATMFSDAHGARRKEVVGMATVLAVLVATKLHGGDGHKLTLPAKPV
jgi:hypothetical protein